jgi:hypothetical protein
MDTTVKSLNSKVDEKITLNYNSKKESNLKVYE